VKKVRANGRSNAKEEDQGRTANDQEEEMEMNGRKLS
jgi:hypothetical protein